MNMIILFISDLLYFSRGGINTIQRSDMNGHLCLQDSACCQIMHERLIKTSHAITHGTDLQGPQHYTYIMKHGVINGVTA